MICANCEERMCITHYYVVTEMYRNQVEEDVVLCSSRCLIAYVD